VTLNNSHVAVLFMTIAYWKLDRSLPLSWGWQTIHHCHSCAGGNPKLFKHENSL